MNDPQIGHACGVFGVYAPGQAVAHLTYLGLYALQHRGQESAGIAVSDGQTITVSKDMGLVTQVFDERRLAPLDGHLAIGHVRYSTTGSSSWRNAQPVYRSVGDAGFALGHNGNLTNTVELAERLGHAAGPGRPATPASTPPPTPRSSPSSSPHEYATERRSDGRDLERALARGAAPARRRLLVRDDGRGAPHRRARPARLLAARARARRGRLGARQRDRRARHRRRALRARGRAGRDDRDRRVGRARPTASPTPDPKLCLFEFVYFARPDTMLYGKSVHAARQRMGEELARQAPVDADMVMPVPESGIPAAQGYARAAGIPYGDGLVKNRYVGRTFIQPNQKQRGAGRAAEAQPAAREHPRQEARRGRRLHRARHHHPSGRADAARGGRRGGALPRVVAAVQVAVLLRHGHRAAARSCSPPTCRSARSATSSASTRSPTSSSTASPRRPARRPTRSAPRASRAATRCRCPLADSKLALEDDSAAADRLRLDDADGEPASRPDR